MASANFSFALSRPAYDNLWPRWLAAEWVFWLVFATWTVLPSTRTPWWTIAGLPVKSTDLLLLPLCVLSLLPRLVPRACSLPAGWHRLLPVAIGLLALWGSASTIWSGSDGRNAFAMTYCMAVTAASGLYAYSIISSVPDIRAFLRRLVVALSAVSLLYTAQSFLGLGLRDAAAVTLNDFGIERVRGPLFEASTGYFLLIPAMAFALEETLKRRLKPLLGAACVFCLAVTLLGLGARAGYVLLAMFVLVCAIFAKGSQRYAAIAILVAISALSAAVIFSRAKTNRLEMKGADGRTLMHQAVAGMVSERSFAQLLTGSGLGSLWPWYLTEVEGGDLYTAGLYVRHTRYGILLYHPHSTVLDLCVELGLPGALFVVALGAVLAGSLRRARALGEETIFAAGVVISAFSIGFDLFLVRRPTRDCVWWIFVFGLLALLARRKEYSS